MPSVTRAAALDELEVVAGDISSLHLQIAEMIRAEHEAKTRSWFEAQSQYMTERDRIAEFNALDISTELMVARGELAALESRRSFLEFTIHWGT